MKKLLLGFIVCVSLTACQSAKDALTLKKKPSSDEFLVEKKSPLVLPPSYGELPRPGEDINESRDLENNELKVTLGKEELKVNEIIKNSEPTPLEKSILKKIK